MVVGDILTFDVPPGHNVWQWQPESAVSEAEFNTCTFNATNGEIWATDSGTKLVSTQFGPKLLKSFQIGSTDTMYFACEIGSHCLAGQKVCIYERCSSLSIYMLLTSPTFSRAGLGAAQAAVGPCAGSG